MAEKTENKKLKKQGGWKKPRASAKKNPPSSNKALQKNMQKKADAPMGAKKPKRNNQKRRSAPKKPKPTVRVFSLGGLNEIGKNITVIECENDIVVVDCGIGFR